MKFPLRPRALGAAEGILKGQAPLEAHGLYSGRTEQGGNHGGKRLEHGFPSVIHLHTLNGFIVGAGTIADLSQGTSPPLP